MIKPDHWIIEFAKNGGVTPYNEDFVNPASYDVTLDNDWICPTREKEAFKSDSFTLYPNEVVLATTKEYVKIPRDTVCDLKLKSSLGRLWLNHSLSGWIDPNFQGQITLELQNIGPYPRVLKAGMRVAQLVFMALESPPTVAYGENGKGHYQGQTGATKAWDDKFFPILKQK